MFTVGKESRHRHRPPSVAAAGSATLHCVGRRASMALPACASPKLDVLDGLEELNICTGHKLDDFDLLPIGADEVARCEPIYETLPGWKESTFGKRWEDLRSLRRRIWNAWGTRRHSD